MPRGWAQPRPASARAGTGRAGRLNGRSSRPLPEPPGWSRPAAAWRESRAGSSCHCGRGLRARGPSRPWRRLRPSCGPRRRRGRPGGRHHSEKSQLNILVEIRHSKHASGRYRTYRFQIIRVHRPQRCKRHRGRRGCGLCYPGHRAPFGVQDRKVGLPAWGFPAIPPGRYSTAAAILCTNQTLFCRLPCSLSVLAE